MSDTTSVKSPPSATFRMISPGAPMRTANPFWSPSIRLFPITACESSVVLIQNATLKSPFAPCGKRLTLSVARILLPVLNRIANPRGESTADKLPAKVYLALASERLLRSSAKANPAFRNLRMSIGYSPFDSASSSILAVSSVKVAVPVSALRPLYQSVASRSGAAADTAAL